MELRRKPPENYRNPMNNVGTVERLEYQTCSYDESNLHETKTVNVYLPKKYNSEDYSTKYNVFYLMHGGGENVNTLLEGPGENSELKCILDHMIENGDIEPMIIVTPTFYIGDNMDHSYLVRNFHYELIYDILPLIQRTYNTYAADATPEAFKASREHRAFGGFSMGGACTWYTFSNCLDYFKYFMPLSGDCWELMDKGGLEKPKETADFLANAARKSGYQKDEYYIYCSTGREDIAYPNLVPQINEMKLLTDVFCYTSTGDNGNFCFAVTDGATHWWHYVYDYIYESLPYFFKPVTCQ